MKLVRDLKSFKADIKTAITIGKFDGIHKGHQEPIHKVLEKKRDGYKTVIFTFDPSPAVFFGFGDGKCLMTVAEKRRVFEKIGVDILVEYQLDSISAAISPESFVEDILIGSLNCGYLCVGDDVSFGHKGKGDAELLTRYKENGAFDLDIISKIRYEGKVISSSSIKKILMTGDMEYVKELIGFPYCITGEVIHGKKLGSKLGMPTLNLKPFPEKLLPPNGVYVSYVSCNGEHYPGISNIGCKPTVSEEKIVGVETFLYNFSGDLYGENISVNLLKFKRSEKKFSSVDELKHQMEDDIEFGRIYHRLP